MSKIHCVYLVTCRQMCFQFLAVRNKTAVDNGVYVCVCVCTCVCTCVCLCMCVCSQIPLPWFNRNPCVAFLNHMTKMNAYLGRHLTHWPRLTRLPKVVVALNLLTLSQVGFINLFIFHFLCSRKYKVVSSCDCKLYFSHHK